jgi:hypothetical protein
MAVKDMFAVTGTPEEHLDRLTRPRFHMMPEEIAFHMRTPAWCGRQAAGIAPACGQVIGDLLADNALDRLRAAQAIIGPAGRHYPAGGRLRACEGAVSSYYRRAGGAAISTAVLSFVVSEAAGGSGATTMVRRWSAQ